MSMIAYSFALQLPYILIGIGFVFLLWPYSFRSNIILKSLLGVGVGAGLSSLLFFIRLLISPGNLKTYFLIELFLLLATLAALLFTRNRLKRHSPFGFQIKKQRWYSWVFFSVFLLSVISWILSFRAQTFMSPHGTFDAYAIWNLRARFIVRGGENWQGGLSPALDWKNHADYPMLTPSLVARSWSFLDEESTRVPIVISAIFSLGLVGLVFAFLLETRGLLLASLGGTLLLSTSSLQFFPITQNADTPLAYYYLATTGLLYLFTQFPQKRFLVLAGIMAGLSGWTKNEGLVFLAGSTLVLLIYFINQTKQISSSLTKLLPYIAGWSVPGIIILFFKTQLASANDMSTGITFQQMVQQLLDGSRYWLILKEFFKIIYAINILEISFIVWVLVLLLLIGKKDPNKSGVLVVLAIMMITLLGYFAIYLITPHPLVWHLNYSADRLLYHLLPITWLIVCFNTHSLGIKHTKIGAGDITIK